MSKRKRPCPDNFSLCGKWDLLSISVEIRGRYEKLKVYAGDEYVWDFGPDSVVRITSSSEDQRSVLARYHFNAKTIELHIEGWSLTPAGEIYARVEEWFTVRISPNVVWLDRIDDPFANIYFPCRFHLRRAIRC